MAVGVKDSACVFDSATASFDFAHPLSIFSCRATEVSVASAVLTVPSAQPVPVVLPVLVETMVLR